jgi:nucleotide-binding universal stress UspA family protein
MKILVGVDGSSASDAALQEVTFRPWRKGSEFQLVTAVDPFFFVRAPQLLDETKKSTKEELEEDAAGLRAKGWPVNTEVLLDNPRHVIPKLATEWRADLAVLGSHGRGTFTRLLIGSTAQAVLRHAPCSVEIVRTPRGDRASADLHGCASCCQPMGQSMRCWRQVKLPRGRGRKARSLKCWRARSIPC